MADMPIWRSGIKGEEEVSASGGTEFVKKLAKKKKEGKDEDWSLSVAERVRS